MRLTPENIEEIKVRFAKTETVEELAQLLSWVYALKFPKRSEKTTILIEAKHLNYYAFKPANRYKQFTIKKKSGGERPISAPRYKLKTIQKCINEILNAVFLLILPLLVLCLERVLLIMQKCISENNLFLTQT